MIDGYEFTVLAIQGSEYCCHGQAYQRSIVAAFQELRSTGNSASIADLIVTRWNLDWAFLLVVLALGTVLTIAVLVFR